MSDFRIDKITNRDGSAGTQIAGITTFSGTSGMQLPVGPTEYRGGRGRGVFHSANPSPGTLTLQYIEIATTGNSADFGDTTKSRALAAGCASATRGIYMGGQPGASPYYVTNIDYVIISSGGGASTFGDLTQGGNNSIDARRGSACGSNDSTRGLIAGGNTPGDGGARKEIDFITMASTGDSSEFGELTVARFDFGQGGMANGTRAVWAGGYQSTAPAPSFSTIDYVNVQSKGDATHFGELSAIRSRLGTTSNTTRGLIIGGTPANPAVTNIIEYITLATTGNVTDFGDTSSGLIQSACCANATRAVSGGGGGPSRNTIEYVTIATTGNATDFGDLLAAGSGFTAVSDVNGGLG